MGNCNRCCVPFLTKSEISAELAKQGIRLGAVSRKRVKEFKIDIDPRGKEHFRENKLKGEVPKEIKEIFGW